MAQDVDLFVRSCLACQPNNPSRPGRLALLQSLEPSALQIRDHIHLDLVDMPKSNEGYGAICTLVDSATGFSIIRLVYDKPSKGVSEALLESFIPYFGCPNSLVND